MVTHIQVLIYLFYFSSKLSGYSCLFVSSHHFVNLSYALKKLSGVLIEISLKLYINLEEIDILTILVYCCRSEHMISLQFESCSLGKSLQLFKNYSIFLNNILQFHMQTFFLYFLFFLLSLLQAKYILLTHLSTSSLFRCV